MAICPYKNVDKICRDVIYHPSDGIISMRRGTEVVITGSTRNRLSRAIGTVGSNPTLSAIRPKAVRPEAAPAVKELS